MEQDRKGWWNVPALDEWRCPQCNEVSPVEQWAEFEVPCDDCGSHDGRECPKCGEVFDHIWGDDRIRDANAPTPAVRG